MERDDTQSAFGVIAVMAVLLAGIGYMAFRAQGPLPNTEGWAQAKEAARAHVVRWPALSKDWARVMVDRYGPPDQTTADALLWAGPRPWRRIVVHRDSPNSPLEHAVDYEFSADRTAQVLALGRGLRIDQAGFEISVQGAGEGANLLALNLADEIARGKTTPEAARDFYDRTAALSAAGKSSPYMEGLLFKPRPPWPRSWEYPEFGAR